MSATSSSVGLAHIPTFRFCAGDSWLMRITYAAAGKPFDLEGSTFGAYLYVRNALAPLTTLTLGNAGASVVDLKGGVIEYTLRPAQSAAIKPDPERSRIAWPTRLVPFVIDTDANLRTAGVCPIEVLDRRFAPPEAFSAIQGAVVAIPERQAVGRPISSADLARDAAMAIIFG